MSTNKLSNSEILPRLFISDVDSALDENFIKNKKITAVLNCTKDVPNKFEKTSSIVYSRLPIDDSLNEIDINKMKKLLPYAIEFIYKHRDFDGGSVLIHCIEGKQRSVCCVLTYLMRYHPSLAPSIREGKKFIISKRPEAFHNNGYINFRSSISHYSKTRLNKQPEKPKKIEAKK